MKAKFQLVSLPKLAANISVMKQCFSSNKFSYIQYNHVKSKTYNMKKWNDE